MVRLILMDTPTLNHINYATLCKHMGFLLGDLWLMIGGYDEIDVEPSRALN